jgi:hypothetical protein
LKKPAENEDLDEELALHKYTISNALSQSGMALCMWVVCINKN